MDQECVLVDTRYFVGLTPTGNTQFNLVKSQDEFKLEMKQGTWWTPITLRNEDTAHSSWMEEIDSATPINSLSSMKNQRRSRKVNKRRTYNHLRPHLLDSKEIIRGNKSRFEA